MRKIFTLFAALLCGLAMNARTLYLNSGGSSLWEADGVDHFAVWHWQGNGEGQWTGWMNRVSGSVWSVEVADASDKVIFARFSNSTSAPSWDGNWGQTNDLTPGSNNLFTITGWDSGKGVGDWSVYDGQGGGGDPITPQPSGAKDYYLKGYCNGKDITTPTAEELFENGTLTYTFTGDDNGKGYFFILVCDAGQVVGDCYMAAAYAEGHCTLVKQDASHIEKLGVPAGTVTFYLYDNKDGSLELSIAPLEGKTLVGESSQGVENTFVNEKAHKTIVDGQLRIIRGDKIFDATGRQIQ